MRGVTGSCKRDVGDFMGSRSLTQLEHEGLLGSVPIRSRPAWRGGAQV